MVLTDARVNFTICQYFIHVCLWFIRLFHNNADVTTIH